MSAPINFGGLSSGIDTNGIIDKLLQIEAQPLQTYQARLNDLQTEQSVLAAFKTKLQAMSSSALALNAPLAFNPIKASSSDTTVATITGTTGAAAGIYNLAVSRLAQAQKISTAAQTDTTSALNLSGTFVVNGKTVKVASTDSLQKIAQNINGAGAGVTASLIDGGSGRAYLTIASNTSGAQNKIQIADVSGSVMGTLGVVSGAATPRETITNGVTSYNFSSSTKTLDQLLPNTGLTNTSFTINGNTVNVDFVNDTLQSLAAKITTAGGNASVRTVTTNGTTSYKLDIVSTVGGDTFTDDNNVLKALGVLQQAPSSELIQAQDAAFTLDGVSLTSSTNTVTSAIPGATVTLLKADSTTPPKSTLTLTKDTDAIKQKIQAFVDSYNAVTDFVNQNSQFDKDTFQSGPLFGDPVAQQVTGTVTSLLFSNMPGATGDYKNLASIGMGLDEDGKITVDDSKLTAAINGSPDSLNSLFETMGTTTDPSLNYIAAGNLTKSGTYSVNITALPTYGSYIAKSAQANPSTISETLTFGGSLFGSTPVTLVVPQGTDHNGLINLINSNSSLNTLVEASDDGSGHLKLVSKKAGTPGNFTVSSDQPNTGDDNSGIGSGTDGTAVAGTDLQGTINGEAATGGANGMLTGNTGNATTSGLQIQYTGSSTGVIGSVTVNKGMAATITDMVAQFTDPVSGLLTSRDQALTAQEDDVNDSITRLQTRVTELQTELRTKFAAMESAIAQIQQQGAQLQSTLKSVSA